MSADDDDCDDCECKGHPAGPNDPMGETVYCDGSCRIGCIVREAPFSLPDFSV